MHPFMPSPESNEPVQSTTSVFECLQTSSPHTLRLQGIQECLDVFFCVAFKCPLHNAPQSSSLSATTMGNDSSPFRTSSATAPLLATYSAEYMFLQSL